MVIGKSSYFLGHGSLPMKEDFGSDDLKAFCYFSDFMLLCYLPLTIKFHGQTDVRSQVNLGGACFFLMF